MNAQQWQQSTDYEEMAGYLHGRGSERKNRLLGCAFCRRVWDLITHPASREVVEVAEHFADGLVDAAELSAALDAAWGVWEEVDERSEKRTLATMALWVAAQTAREQHNLAGWSATEGIRIASSDGAVRALREREVFPDLIREIYGNPFCPVLADPSWLAWDGGAVQDLAGVIYLERRFADMPRLADSLERAGCRDAQFLDHCRAQTEHFRGCWVLDELLGYPGMVLNSSDWQRCTAPSHLLYFLRFLASDRKLRLCACACGHALESDLRAACEKRAIAIAGRFADGKAGIVDMAAARAEVLAWDAQHPTQYEWHEKYQNVIPVSHELAPHQVTYAVLEEDAWQAACLAALCFWRPEQPDHQPIACQIIRDIFPYPLGSFRLEPGCRTPGVVALAQTIYDGRLFHRMPELGDALAVNGCHDPAILNHCRSDGMHVRGCWVLDLVLDKL
jgi:hypothetical protein